MAAAQTCREMAGPLPNPVKDRRAAGANWKGVPAMKNLHRRSRPVTQARKRHRQQRLLYRRGFTPDEVRRVVLEIGPMRVLGVIDELTQPPPSLMAAAEGRQVGANEGAQP